METVRYKRLLYLFNFFVSEQGIGEKLLFNRLGLFSNTIVSNFFPIQPDTYNRLSIIVFMLGFVLHTKYFPPFWCYCFFNGNERRFLEKQKLDILYFLPNRMRQFRLSIIHNWCRSFSFYSLQSGINYLVNRHFDIF